MHVLEQGVFILVAFGHFFGSCYIAKVDICLCSGDDRCSILIGEIKDGHFVAPLTPILDLRIPLRGLKFPRDAFCPAEGGHLTKRGFLLDTPILGLSLKHDCTGMTLDAHLGIPGLEEAHTSLHGGTDGVDASASNTFSGVKVGIHGGTDGNGKPQGGINAGVGVGKYANADVHLNAGASGTSIGASVQGSMPGDGPSAKGSIDYNLNNGKITASGNVDGGNGACVKGSKDITDPVKDFMNKVGQMGMQTAVNQHISQHGDAGTGFNPATFMQQAGMNNFMQNMG